MAVYIEALILYVVLFFSGSAGSAPAAGADSFSISWGLTSIFIYSIPSLALIWYLMLRVKKAKDWDILPGKKDLIPGLLTFSCLLIIGFTTAFVSSYIGGTAAQVSFHLPSSALGWVVLCASCFSSAYLEESYFRFYLLARRDELHLSAPSALAVSVALFSICHIYEGPWGFLNSVLSGALLAFVFLRYRSLHGIAVAHSLYNISVYVINSALN
jgi:membrane protease YdiL (CAAX protease family)